MANILSGMSLRSSQCSHSAALKYQFCSMAAVMFTVCYLQCVNKLCSNDMTYLGFRVSSYSHKWIKDLHIWPLTTATLKMHFNWARWTIKAHTLCAAKRSILYSMMRHNISVQVHLCVHVDQHPSMSFLKFTLFAFVLPGSHTDYHIITTHVAVVSK